MADLENIPHPPIVSHAASVAARKTHLVNEKELTKQLDALRAERRRLPMKKLDKRYLFDGPTWEVISDRSV